MGHAQGACKLVTRAPPGPLASGAAWASRAGCGPWGIHLPWDLPGAHEYVGHILIGRTWHRCPGPAAMHTLMGNPSCVARAQAHPLSQVPSKEGLCQDNRPHSLCSQAGLRRTLLLSPGPAGNSGHTAFSSWGRVFASASPGPASQGFMSPSPQVFTACVQVAGPPSCGGLWAVGRTTWAGLGALSSHPGLCEGQAAGRGQSSPAQAVDRGPGCDREASWDSVFAGWAEGEGQTLVLHPLRHLPGPSLEGISAEPAGTPQLLLEEGLQAAPRAHSTTPGPAVSQRMSW